MFTIFISEAGKYWETDCREASWRVTQQIINQMGGYIVLSSYQTLNLTEKWTFTEPPRFRSQLNHDRAGFKTVCPVLISLTGILLNSNNSNLSDDTNKHHNNLSGGNNQSKHTDQPTTITPLISIQYLLDVFCLFLLSKCFVSCTHFSKQCSNILTYIKQSNTMKELVCPNHFRFFIRQTDIRGNNKQPHWSRLPYAIARTWSCRITQPIKYWLEWGKGLQ